MCEQRFLNSIDTIWWQNTLGDFGIGLEVMCLGVQFAGVAISANKLRWFGHVLQECISAR